MTTVFASTSSYVAGRLFGQHEAVKAINELVISGVVAEDSLIPAAMSLHVLAELYDVALRVDGGATSIGRSRARSMAAALASGRDVWVTIDDDVTASAATLAWLVDAVEGSEPRVCMAPYLVRGVAGVASVDWSEIYLERALPRGGLVRSARQGGFGLVAMNRAAMQAASLGAPMFRDDDGERRAAAFLELVTEAGEWLSEDLAFFRRLPRTVRVEALITGETWHAGARLDLADTNGPIFPLQSLNRLTSIAGI